MLVPADSATTEYCSGNSPTMSSVCVPMLPVLPSRAIGFGPAPCGPHTLPPAGASARPGQAGGTTTRAALGGGGHRLRRAGRAAAVGRGAGSRAVGMAAGLVSVGRRPLSARSPLLVHAASLAPRSLLPACSQRRGQRRRGPMRRGVGLAACAAAATLRAASARSLHASAAGAAKAPAAAAKGKKKGTGSSRLAEEGPADLPWADRRRRQGG